MSNKQSNTQIGPISVIANEALTGKEGYLAVLVEDTNVLEAKLPDTVLELALFVITEGAAAGAYAELMPLEPGKNIRMKLKGTCNPGDVLKLYTPDGTHDGKVAAIGSTAGIYFSPGVAEEEGVDGQLLLVRPMPRLVSVNSAHVADPASAAALTQDSLTDNSGGTPATTIAAIGATYSQSEVANAIASLAAQLAKIKVDVAAVRTGSEANNTAIDSINAALAEQKVTAAA
jgi:hypothetical protein